MKNILVLLFIISVNSIAQVAVKDSIISRILTKYKLKEKCDVAYKPEAIPKNKYVNENDINILENISKQYTSYDSIKSKITDTLRAYFPVDKLQELDLKFNDENSYDEASTIIDLFYFKTLESQTILVYHTYQKMLNENEKKSIPIPDNYKLLIGKWALLDSYKNLDSTHIVSYIFSNPDFEIDITFEFKEDNYFVHSFGSDITEFPYNIHSDILNIFEGSETGWTHKTIKRVDHNYLIIEWEPNHFLAFKKINK